MTESRAINSRICARGEKMNTRKNLLTTLSHDKALLALLSGAVLSGIGLMSMVAAACAWYF